ncbi:hypothetical protein KO116_01649 [Halomonas sp. KO116]|nr:hypothetical protein KO116_01649 [Halomonas sp. KO116]
MAKPVLLMLGNQLSFSLKMLQDAPANTISPTNIGQR